MTERVFVPGDFIIRGGDTALVWSITPTALVVLTLQVKSEPSQTSSADIGRVPFATITGSSVVNTRERAEWRASECLKIGHMTPAQATAIKFATKRSAENYQIESRHVSSEIFAACMPPSHRSGGRRVGGARAA